MLYTVRFANVQPNHCFESVLEMARRRASVRYQINEVRRFELNHSAEMARRIVF